MGAWGLREEELRLLGWRWRWDWGLGWSWTQGERGWGGGRGCCSLCKFRPEAQTQGSGSPKEVVAGRHDGLVGESQAGWLTHAQRREHLAAGAGEGDYQQQQQLSRHLPPLLMGTQLPRPPLATYEETPRPAGTQLVCEPQRASAALLPGALSAQPGPWWGHAGCRAPTAHRSDSQCEASLAGKHRLGSGEPCQGAPWCPGTPWETLLGGNWELR